MWSLGCTLFELFQKLSPNLECTTETITGNRDTPASSNILFPGTSCFPLSMRKNMNPERGSTTTEGSCNDMITDKND